MITAVDTNVLLDVFAADARFGPPSAREFRRAFAQGSVVACEVVWAEVAGVFPSAEAARNGMRELAIEFSPVSEAVGLAAGAAWKEYRRRGGRRERVIADYLIGAHALAEADALL